MNAMRKEVETIQHNVRELAQQVNQLAEAQHRLQTNLKQLQQQKETTAKP